MQDFEDRIGTLIDPCPVLDGMEVGARRPRAGESIEIESEAAIRRRNDRQRRHAHGFAGAFDLRNIVGAKREQTQVRAAAKAAPIKVLRRTLAFEPVVDQLDHKPCRILEVCQKCYVPNLAWGFDFNTFFSELLAGEVNVLDTYRDLPIKVGRGHLVETAAGLEQQTGLFVRVSYHPVFALPHAEDVAIEFHLGFGVRGTEAYRSNSRQGKGLKFQPPSRQTNGPVKANLSIARWCGWRDLNPHGLAATRF